MLQTYRYTHTHTHTHTHTRADYCMPPGLLPPRHLAVHTEWQGVDHNNYYIREVKMLTKNQKYIGGDDALVRIASNVNVATDTTHPGIPQCIGLQLQASRITNINSNIDSSGTTICKHNTSWVGANLATCLQ